MGNASRDENHVTTLLGVSSADGVTPVEVKVDGNGRMLVEGDGSVDVGGGSTPMKQFVSGNALDIASGATRATANDDISSVAFPDGGSGICRAMFLVPDDATSISSIVFTMDSQNPGDYNFDYATKMTADGVAPVSDSLANQTVTSNNSRRQDITIPASAYDGLTVAGGSVLSVFVTRNGGAGADTIGTEAYLVGITVTFA